MKFKINFLRKVWKGIFVIAKRVLRALKRFKVRIVDYSLVAITLVILLVYEFANPSLSLDINNESLEFTVGQHNNNRCLFQLELDIHVVNYSPKSGYVNGVKILLDGINPTIDENKDYVDFSVRYIDKRKIHFLESKIIKVIVMADFESCSTLEKRNKFLITFQDNRGGIVSYKNNNNGAELAIVPELNLKNSSSIPPHNFSVYGSKKKN